MLKIQAGWLFAIALVVSGCTSTGMDTSTYKRARFVLESSTEGEYTALVTLPVSKVQIPVEGDAVLSEFDYQSIELMEVSFGKCILFSLKPPAARAFYQISVANQGKRMVLVINGQPIGVRRIDGPIANGQVFVFLEITDDSLEELVKQLKETNIDIQKKLNR